MIEHLFTSLLEEVSATEIGFATKQVECEICGEHYEYHMMRRSHGHAFKLGGGRGGAQRKAQECLRKSLHEECEPAPCPKCGWFQNHMLPRARKLRYRWMAKAGLYLFPVSVILASIAGLMDAQDPINRAAPRNVLLVWISAGVCAALAVGFPTLKLVLSCRFNPNAGNPDLKDLFQRDGADRDGDNTRAMN
jgi:hypothetical protein